MKKVLLLGIILAMALTLVMPSVVMASQPTAFSATGIFTSIDEGNVSLQTDGKWLVENRHIWGEFSSAVAGQTNILNGAFTITYDALVDPYQAGDFTGILDTDSATFTVTGYSQVINFYELYNHGIYRIDLEGEWTGTQGINGSGTFTAYFDFTPQYDAFGNMHVGSVNDSSFNMIGVYDSDSPPITPPVPELPAGALLASGLGVMAAFFIVNSKKQTAVS